MSVILSWNQNIPVFQFSTISQQWKNWNSGITGILESMKIARNYSNLIVNNCNWNVCDSKLKSKYSSIPVFWNNWNAGTTAGQWKNFWNRGKLEYWNFYGFQFSSYSRIPVFPLLWNRGKTGILEYFYFNWNVCDSKLKSKYSSIPVFQFFHDFTTVETIQT